MYYTERMAEVRNYHGLKQTEVAEKMGLKREQYRRYEKGINEMPILKLKKFCEVLNVSPEYILGFSDEIKPLPNP